MFSRKKKIDVFDVTKEQKERKERKQKLIEIAEETIKDNELKLSSTHPELPFIPFYIVETQNPQYLVLTIDSSPFHKITI